MRYRIAASTLAFSSLFLFALACGKTDRSQGTASPPAAASASARQQPQPAPAEVAAQERDAQIAQKLNAYINCLNNISNQISRCREDYLEYADEKNGPDTKKAPSFNLYISADGACLDGLAKVKSLPPPLPDVEPAVVAYEQSLREVLPLIKQVKEYYSQGNYKDDKFARGKTMHPPLVAAFAKFTAANKVLDEKVAKLDDELSERRLAALQKDPDQKLHYLVARSEKEAKAVVNAGVVKTFKELELEKYAALVDTYEKTLGEIDAYVPAHKDAVEKVNSFELFDRNAKPFLTAAKELMRAKRDGKDFTKEGNPKQLLDKYNQFITSCNSMYFR